VKVLIIGFGSIGRRHFEILSAFKDVETVDLVTKQNIEGTQCFKSLIDVPSLDSYAYFVIASETVKHHEQLFYLSSNVRDKLILVEKPLYEAAHGDVSATNKIYTAYNLRFHPVLVKLKEMLADEEVYYANIICGQYLPSWRPDTDYKQSYSANLEQGGGVLRDLSHELDYMCWLFGAVERFSTISVRRSDLKIKSDDIFTGIGVTSGKTIVNVTMDYLSKTPIRRLIIHTENNTIEADVINNKIVLSEKEGESRVIEVGLQDRNYTYTRMHESILSGEDTFVCSFEEGLGVVGLIDQATYEEL